MSSEKTLYDVANEILDNSRKGICGGCGATLSEALLVCNIAAALAAERAKFAAFADEKGEPMRVANPLPRTADNCIVVPFVSVVYHPNHPERTLDVDVCNDEVIGQVGVPDESRGTDWYEYPIAECYSTQAAATSALDAAKEQP